MCCVISATDAFGERVPVAVDDGCVGAAVVGEVVDGDAVDVAAPAATG